MLATLGAAGAVLVDDDGAWLATPPPITPRSTVGAGDSSLAGYVRADVGGAEAPQRLQMAVAYGSGAAALPGSALPSPAQIDLDDVRSPRFPPIPPRPVYAPLFARLLTEECTMTNPVSIISTDLVLLDVDAGADKESVIDRLAGRLADSGRVTDPDGAHSRGARPGGAVGHRIARRHRHPALPVGCGVDPSIGFARLSRRSTSAHPTARPIWCS